MTEDLQKKVDRAIRLLQSAGKIAKEHGQPLEICYSGGKDSDIILELAKMSDVDYRAIYKNTTIDPKGTIKHVQDMGVEIIRPKYSFFDMVAKYGMPTRFRRFCCSILKEYKVLDYAVIGVRREESKKREALYKEPERCRVYNKKDKVRQYLPILDWTAKDVEGFITERGIKCAPVYYDENGSFHVERRLGCMCCPLQGYRVRLNSFINTPNMVKAYIRAIVKYRETHPNSKTVFLHTDAYAQFVHDVFFSGNQQGWLNQNNGLFAPPDYKKFLEDYFNIKFKLYERTDRDTEKVESTEEPEKHIR